MHKTGYSKDSEGSEAEVEELVPQQWSIEYEVINLPICKDWKMPAPLLKPPRNQLTYICILRPSQCFLCMWLNCEIEHVRASKFSRV